jgi:putative hydrolase of the HAD superfamily
MITTIAFDLWETLITNTPEVSRRQKDLRLRTMEHILRESGQSVAAGKIEEAHRTSWHRCQDLYWSMDRDISCRTQVEHFLEDLGLSPGGLPIDALEDAYARAAVHVLPAPVDGAKEVIEELKENGYRLGLISNTGRTPGYALREVLDALGLAGHFEAMVFSNEHGACKPQRSIFETLRTAVGVGFEEMMFVGDNLYVDVRGAQACGMTAVHFVPPQRGTAIAPHVEHGLEIVPDATITDLRQLPGLIRTIEPLQKRA